jgi:hypothetical protein
MKLSRQVLLAVCIVPLLGPSGAFAQAQGGKSAQDDKWGKPIDLKELLPPVKILPLPRDSQLNPGSLGGTETTSPLQNPTSNQQSPGIRLTIPTR